MRHEYYAKQSNFYKFQVYVFTLRPLIGALLMHSIITVSEAGKCPVKLLHRIKLCRFVGETSTKTNIVAFIVIQIISNKIYLSSKSNL